MPISLEEAWRFFSDPANLKRITPPYMNFEILSELPDESYEGMIITYKLSPFPFTRVQWITEITICDKPNFFVDEQRFGPYRFWHHQHVFKKIDSGVEMQDIVNYVMPYGMLGRAANFFVVSHQLNKIFDYRANALQTLITNKDF